MKALILLALIISPPLFGEYRVYQYSVKLKSSPQNDPVSYKKISTLDPVSFMAYNGGRSAVKVDLLRTWMCFGNTANKKKICPPPSSVVLNKLNAQAEERP